MKILIEALLFDQRRQKVLRIDVKNLRRETARFVGGGKKKKKKRILFLFFLPSFLSIPTARRFPPTFSSTAATFPAGQEKFTMKRNPLAKTHHVTPLSRSCMYYVARCFRNMFARPLFLV